MKRKTIGVALLGATLFLSSCATASAPADLMGVHYAGGSLSAKKFVDCLEPSNRSGFDPGDGYYFYPTRQISYEASQEENAERGRFTVVSDDNAELFVPIRVTMQLDTKCDTLRKFHEEIGARYNAYIEDGHSSADYPQGWIDLLNDVVGKPLDATVDRVAQKYEWREVWNNEEVRVEMEDEIEKSIEAMVNAQSGGDFFTDFTVLVNKPDPKDEALKSAISKEQAAVADAKSREAAARADKAVADATTATAKAEAATKRAIVLGFKLPGMTNREALEAYLESLRIEKGINSEQPTYLYGGAPQ